MINRTGLTIFCDPRGSYNDMACPVCGDTNTRLMGECADNDSSTEWRRCHSCGSRYSLTYRLASISIERDGRYGLDD